MGKYHISLNIFIFILFLALSSLSLKSRKLQQTGEDFWNIVNDDKGKQYCEGVRPTYYKTVQYPPIHQSIIDSRASETDYIDFYQGKKTESEYKNSIVKGGTAAMVLLPFTLIGMS